MSKDRKEEKEEQGSAEVISPLLSQTMNRLAVRQQDDSLKLLSLLQCYCLAATTMIAKKHIHMNTKRIMVRYTRMVYNALKAALTQEFAL